MQIFIKHKRSVLLGLADILTIVCSCLFVYFFLTFISEMDLEGLRINIKTKTVMLDTSILAASACVGLRLAKVYSSIWRYATIRDYAKCVLGGMIGLLIYYVVRITTRIGGSDLIVVMGTMLSLIGMVGIRMAYCYLYSRISNTQDVKKIRTLIVGGGDTGHKIITEMRVPESIYRPVVIVDDDFSKRNRDIQGISIVGGVSDIPQVVEKYKIETILIAIPSCTKEQKKHIINICSETMCEVKTVPHLYDIVASDNLLEQAKSINIEDLLGRDVIKFDDRDVKNLVQNKVCMVTGGGGSIGSELCRQIAKYSPKKLIIVDIYENNAYDIQQELLANYPDIDLDVRIASVRDYDKMNMLFELFKPELVYHAAAHKHVPLMETSPEEAIKNNIVGTYNIASLANFFGVKKFVLVSTDKAVNPTNVMGATKRCCEMIVQYFAQKSTKTEFVAVRFGNVLGSNGSVIPLFEKQIAQGGPVTVTHPDIIRYFMTIPEAVSLILQAGTIARGGEIFVLDMGEPVKILSLAENLIKLHGKAPYKDIAIEFSGLRPGEKLFEELLMSEEGLRETENKKIFIGKQIEINENEFVSAIEHIRTVAATNNSDDVVEELRKIVPTFNHVVINR